MIVYVVYTDDNFLENRVRVVVTDVNIAVAFAAYNMNRIECYDTDTGHPIEVNEIAGYVRVSDTMWRRK